MFHPVKVAVFFNGLSSGQPHFFVTQAFNGYKIGKGLNGPGTAPCVAIIETGFEVDDNYDWIADAVGTLKGKITAKEVEIKDLRAEISNLLALPMAER